MCKEVGVDVSLQVIDGDEGELVDIGERLGSGDADEERPHQPRPMSDGNPVHRLPLNSRFPHRLLNSRTDQLEVLPRCYFRDNSPELGVNVDLGADDIGQHPPAVLNDGNGSLIATRFNSQD